MLNPKKAERGAPHGSIGEVSAFGSGYDPEVKSGMGLPALRGA